MTDAHTGSSPSSNKNLLLFIITITSFINPFMGAAVNIALPDMAEELGLNAITMGWVTMSFLLASVAVLLPIGKIADIAGRKKLFIIGNVIVTLASAFCAISPNASLLIASRLLQGFGGAMMFGTGTAMITSAFPPQQRGRALGINVSAVYLGLTLAPILGGFLTDLFGWRSIFWLNVPFGLFVIPATMYAIKTEWHEAKGESFDYGGSAIYVVSIAMLMYGFSKLPGPVAVALTLAGIAGLALFVRNEFRVESPIMDMRLFTGNRTFAFSNLAALINYAATYAVTFLLSLYLQYIKGMKPSDAGMLLVMQPILMTIVATFSGRLSDRVDPRILSSTGMGIIVIGLAMLAFIGDNTSHAFIIASLVILGAGFGLFSSPNTNAVMSSVEKRQLGVASASIGTMRLAGQMMSMAIATLTLHIFLGSSKIGPENHFSFITAARIVFAIFAVLCIIGVFASLARGKKSVAD
ncbi:MAG TPA: MFS transporter [Bacteroidales bacterium]|nr:MFS transporter [Bacteroidales bacterium]